jgi:hypothetical protein
MKIFKRKKSSSQHELLQQIGVGSYFEIPNDFDADSWNELNIGTFRRHSLRRVFRQRMRRLPYKFGFERIVDNFASSVYEIGRGDFNSFAEEHRYAPRANYLLKNKWVAITFGIYQIEYTITEEFAFSHFSLNHGLTYLIHMETELTKNRELNFRALINLFQETEEYLLGTIVDRSPPYAPKY